MYGLHCYEDNVYFQYLYKQMKTIVGCLAFTIQNASHFPLFHAILIASKVEYMAVVLL
jgi:hypothetical protein